MISRPAAELCLGVLLFLASLSSWYFYDLGLSPMPVVSFVGLAGLTLWVLRREGCRPVHLLALALALLPVAAVSLAQLVRGEFAFHHGRLLGLVTFTASLPMVALVLSGRTFSRVRLERVLGGVLALHVGVVLIQLLYFMATRQYLDLLFGITGEWQRVYGSKGLNLGIYRLPRFAGLFNEPGTYSAAMLPLFFLYRLYRGRPDLLYGISLFSVLLTMSAFGLAGVMLCLLYDVFRHVSRRTFTLSAFALLTLALAGALVLMPAYESRFSGADVGSLRIREAGLAAFASLDVSEYLFGRGAAVDARECADCIGLYMGTGLTYLFYNGLVAWVLTFLVVPLVPWLDRLAPARLATWLLFLVLVSMLKIKFVYPWLGWLLGLGALVVFRPRRPEIKQTAAARPPRAVLRGWRHYLPDWPPRRDGVRTFRSGS